MKKKFVVTMLSLMSVMVVAGGCGSQDPVQTADAGGDDAAIVTEAPEETEVESVIDAEPTEAVEAEGDFTEEDIKDVFATAMEVSSEGAYTIDGAISVDIDVAGEGEDEQAGMAMNVIVEHSTDGQGTYTYSTSNIDVLGESVVECKESIVTPDGAYERSAETEDELVATEWTEMEGESDDAVGQFVNSDVEGIDFSQATMTSDGTEYMITMPASALSSDIDMTSLGVTDENIDMTYVMTVDIESGAFTSIVFALDTSAGPVVAEMTADDGTTSTVTYNALSIMITREAFDGVIELPVGGEQLDIDADAETGDKAEAEATNAQ